MKKLVLFLFCFFLFSIFLVNSAEARSGCCSHHGGVCGCECCDGTSLSATCAPYYPSCNSNPMEPVYVREINTVTENKVIPVYEAAAVMSGAEASNSNVVSPVVINNQIDNAETKEIIPLIDEPKQILNLENDVSKEDSIQTDQASLVQVPIDENKTSENNDNGFWGGLIFWGAVGYIIYLVKKKKSKKDSKKENNQ